MILIITGPPAAGKSTVGPLIAKSLERCAVIDVDLVRLMLAKPHVPPWLGNEGQAQLRLGAENGCLLARNFAEDGCDVVLLDVLTNETAQIYRRHFDELEHKIVLLMPTLAESLNRNRERGQFLRDKEVRLLYGWEQALTDFDLKIENADIPVYTLAERLSRCFCER